MQLELIDKLKLTSISMEIDVTLVTPFTPSMKTDMETWFSRGYMQLELINKLKLTSISKEIDVTLVTPITPSFRVRCHTMFLYHKIQSFYVH